MKRGHFMLGTLTLALFGLSVARAQGSLPAVETKRLSAPSPVSVSERPLSSEASFTLSGEPSPFQQREALLIRCEMAGSQPIYRGCRDATLVSLNEPTGVAAGTYILAYSNMLYPGLIRLAPGTNAELELMRLDLTTESKSADLRIYRDLSRLEEAFKVYLYEFAVGEGLSPRPLKLRDGKDLVPARTLEANANPPTRSNLCGTFSGYRGKKASILCRKRPENFLDVAPYFRFLSSGEFTMFRLRPEGDTESSRRARLLVAPTLPVETRRELKFVNVLPGYYRIDANVNGKSTVRTSGPMGETSLFAGSAEGVLLRTNFGQLPDGRNVEQLLRSAADGQRRALADKKNAELGGVDGAETVLTTDEGDTLPSANLSCMSEGVTKWHTDLRQFCTDDTQPGCHRKTARYCEVATDLK